MTKPEGKPAAPRRENKADWVIALLKRKQGATLEEMIETIGWLPHTTRGAMTGLKQKGHAIERTKVDGVSRYSITANAGAVA